MSVMRPFRAWRHAKNLSNTLADLLVPPYDVINPTEQTAFYDRHPDNLIRLELGREETNDNEQNNRYTRAANALANWQQRNVLTREEKPAFYVYQQTFTVPGTTEKLTRTGFFGSLQLAPWGEGILPHEKTFPGAKADRLTLLRHTGVQTGAIFTMFRDPGNQALNQAEEITKTQPIAALTDNAGVEHRLWAIQEAESTQNLAAAVRERTFYVADGHHRYETALNYQRERGAGNGTQPWDYVLTFAVPLENAGLRILAAHRCLHNVPDLRNEDVLRGINPFFESTSFTDVNALQNALASHAPGSGHFGLLLSGTEGGLLLKPRANATMPPELPSVLADLDVAKLQTWALGPVLKNITDDLADKRFIAYEPNLTRVADGVATGQFQAAFLLNATSLSQLCDVADAGEVMPQKATYFYPKLISGIVIHDVSSF